VAEAYERGRPGWPREAVAALADRFGLGADSTVVDLGAGTGKLTRLLCERAGRVIAVEPVPGMRAMLARRLPHVEAVDARAEALPVDASSVDLGVAGEAFHWFDSDRAVAELARVLRPGGGVGLLWNVHAWTDHTHPWLAEVGATLRDHRTEAIIRHFTDQDRWRSSFERSDAFEPVQLEHFHHEQRLDLDGFMAQLSSWSLVAGLPAPRRQAALAAVRRTVGADLERWGTAEVVIPYRTELHWTTRR